jgi:hypothetical protein
MSMIGCFVAIDDATASQICSAPEQIEKFLYPYDGNSIPQNYLEIDKAWHGIHYLLTGSAEEGPEPLTWAVFLGGDEIGEDMGYGPARLLSAEHVRLIANALPNENVFVESYDPKAMEKAEIYPSIWVREGEEALEYLLEYYQELRKFYQAAATRGDRVIQWIS